MLSCRKLCSALVVVIALGACPWSRAGAGEGEGDAAGEGEGEGEGELAACAPTCTGNASCEPAQICAAGVCTFPACASDLECTARFSAWVAQGCAVDRDCAAGSACVKASADASGIGACAALVVNDRCDAPLVVVGADDTDGSSLSVCGIAGKCDAGSCSVAPAPAQCTADADCARNTAGFNACVNGRCGCNDDAQCVVPEAPGPHCSASHVCGCGADADCANAEAGSRCDVASGGCTCAADGDCGAGQRCANP